MGEEKAKTTLEIIKETGERLKPKEKRFCECYLECGNKTEAAIRAGYSEKSARNQGYRLMKRDDILAYTHALQARAREELGIDDNWAALKAIEVYNRCMKAVPVMEWDYSEHKMVPTGEYAFDSKGAIGALELLRKLLGLGEADKGKINAAVVFIDDMGGGKAM